jgi:lysophospholipase L1-like esterase
MKLHLSLLATIAILASALPLRAADEATGPVIFDMETCKHKPTDSDMPTGEKKPCGTVESVEGKFGKACKFDFLETKNAQFMTASMKMPAEADSCDGFSFWVKGDGSDNFGGLEFIDGSDYKLRYGFCFPLKSTEWTKITVPWRDLIPEIAAPLVGAKGYKPSRFGNLWFGKFYYWPDKVAISYTIDQIALEKKIDAPKAETPKGEPLANLAAKIKDKKPITFVSMGDSLTDKKHNSNANTKTWAEQVAAGVKGLGSETTYVNPALGGTALSQNLVLMPRWLAGAPSPDVVTVFFGFNDYDNGVRGDLFKDYLRLAVDRIRTMTNGSADVILMTTCPAFGRWDSMKEMADAVRAVAKEKNCGLVDIDAEFHKSATAADAKKAGYWSTRDDVHLGPAGHKLIAEAVLKVIKEAK